MIHNDPGTPVQAVTCAAEVAIRVKNVEILAIIGGPWKVVGSEGHLKWRSIADLVEAGAVEGDSIHPHAGEEIESY